MCTLTNNRFFLCKYIGFQDLKRTLVHSPRKSLPFLKWGLLCCSPAHWIVFCITEFECLLRFSFYFHGELSSFDVLHDKLISIFLMNMPSIMFTLFQVIIVYLPRLAEESAICCIALPPFTSQKCWPLRSAILWLSFHALMPCSLHVCLAHSNWINSIWIVKEVVFFGVNLYILPTTMFPSTRY